MHGALPAVEAAPDRLAVASERLGWRGRGRDRWAQVRLGPPRQHGLEGHHVQGDQDLAGPPRLRGRAREAELVHQRDVLVLAPWADRRIALGARHDGTADQGEDGGKGVPPSVPTAGIGDLGKKGKQAPSERHIHATPPCNTSPGKRASIAREPSPIPPGSNCQEPWALRQGHCQIWFGGW